MKPAAVFGVVMFLYAWLTSWANLIECSVSWYLHGWDVRQVATVIVLLLGLVMTNTLGYYHFAREGRRMEALLAAVDLDTPYIIKTQGARILEEEDCPEWNQLQIRQAMWRSVPLAVVGFCLAGRVFLEVPSCQLAASFSSAFYSFGLEDGTFTQALQKSSLAPEALDFQNAMKAKPLVEWLGLYQAETLLTELREVENKAWASSHCGDSSWFKIETYPLVSIWSPFASEDFAEYGGYGGIGTGNLVMAVNIVAGEVVKNAFVRDGTALKSIIDEVAGQLTKEMAEAKGRKPGWANFVGGSTTLVARAMTWETQVNLIFERIVSSRGVDIARDLAVQDRGWWPYLEFLQSCLLLMSAAVPIVKHVAKQRQVKELWQTASLHLHCVLDLVLMTATLVLSALAPTAQRGAHVISEIATTWVDMALKQKFLIRSLPVFLRRGFESCVGKVDFQRNPCWHGFDETTFKSDAKALVASVLGNVEELIDAVAMEPELFLAAGLCVLTFWAASAVLVKAMLPKAAVPSSLMPVNAGIGGPIYVLSDMDEIHIKKAIPKIFQLLALRTFLFTAFLAAAWRKAEVYDARLLFAWMFNRLTTPSQLRTLWLVACLLHLASGYVAVCAIEMSHRVKRMKSGG